MSFVSEKSNWINKNIKYLKNVSITEYDIHDGGLSIISEYQLLPKNKIEKLKTYEKQQKNIVIGKLQAKNPDLAKNMVEGFGKARELFVTQNNIPIDNILTIKKDAIFLINMNNINGAVTKNIEFRPKNKYSSYINLCNKEFYLSFGELTIKGLSEESINLQKDYLLSDICRFLSQAEKIDSTLIVENLRKYSKEYLTKKLPLNTYRNLDNGQFELFSDGLGDYTLEEIDETFLDDLNISYNYLNYVLPMIHEILNNIL